MLGLRAALLTSVLSVAFLVFFMEVSPKPILGVPAEEAAVTVGVWAGFLILTSAVTGVLYEKKERKVRELHSAYVGVLEILSKYIESNDRYTLGLPGFHRTGKGVGDAVLAEGPPGVSRGDGRQTL